MPVRVLYVLCAYYAFSSVGQLHAQEPDPFIGTIEKIKHAIGPVTCPHATGNRSIELGPVHGTAFFVDTHGVFLTAGHVIKGVLEAGENQHCETTAVLIPATEWSVAKLDVYALRFVPADCKLDEAADLARCTTIEDPTNVDKILSKPIALAIESELQPDGTAVAFSGFPVAGIIPYTARANIAGYQIAKSGSQQVSQVSGVVLDRPPWSGASGSPVYRQDGRVIGLMQQRGTDGTAGLSFARAGARVNEFLNAP